MSTQKPLGISIFLHVLVFVGGIASSFLGGCKEHTIEAPHVFDVMNIPLTQESPKGKTSKSSSVQTRSAPMPNLKLPNIKPLVAPPEAEPEPEPPAEVEPPKAPVEVDPPKKVEPKQPQKTEKSKAPSEPEPDSDVSVPVKKTSPTTKKATDTAAKPVAYEKFAESHNLNKSKPSTSPQPKSVTGETVKTPKFNAEKFSNALSKGIEDIELKLPAGSGVSKGMTDAMNVFGNSLRNRIEQAWSRPSVTGRAIINIIVGADGSITASLLKSSGNELFDKSVLEAVRSVRRMPLPPGGDTLTFELPFSIYE